jgi:Transposase, Mutator family
LSLDLSRQTKVSFQGANSNLFRIPKPLVTFVRKKRDISTKVTSPDEVVDIFPNEAAIMRLVGAILLEQNDEWAVQRSRYITLESIAPVSHDPIVGLPISAD